MLPQCLTQEIGVRPAEVRKGAGLVFEGGGGGGGALRSQNGPNNHFLLQNVFVPLREVLADLEGGVL